MTWLGRFGLGCAQLGNLYSTMDDATAAGIVDAAWECGIRYFDTAPHYGLGLSERRLGWALRGRGGFRVSTKVGRLLVPDPDGASRTDPGGFHVPGGMRREWDFSADGVRRSLAGSLERLGLDRVDVVLLHDPEGRERAALDEAFPALCDLRDQGAIGAVGVGSMDAGVLQWFVERADLDVVMVAGRFTLLEQPALDGLLPAAAARGVPVVNAGVFNSGLLAVDQPHSGLPYEYGTAPDGLVRKVAEIAAVCARHGTSLPAAALAYAGSHPAVATVVIGADDPAQVRRNVTLPPPPEELWVELRRAGLLP